MIVRSFFWLAVSTSVLFVSVWGGGFTNAAETEPGSPVNLRCEYRVNPLGVDQLTPRFSWEVNVTRRGAVQTAYRILVASSIEKIRKREPDLWDSGKVETDRSNHVVYAGPKLDPATRYYWALRTWGQTGITSRYSDVAYWETGLLSNKDWEGTW